MSLKDKLNRVKRRGLEKDEWYRLERSQNSYEVVAKNDCPSWDLEFWFLYKYKNKNTCEVRWKKRHRARMFDKTVFNTPPEEYIDDDYVLIGKDIEIYEGPKI